MWESLKALGQDDNLLFFSCAFVMILCQIVLCKKQKLYNIGKDMEEHPLNRIYHINWKGNPDIQGINARLAAANIAAIVLSCIVGAFFSFEAALVSLAIGFLAFNFGMTAYIGKTAGNS